MDMSMLLYLKWITNKDLLSSTGNSAQHYVTVWMGGEPRGEDVYSIWTTEFLCHSPKTITTLFINRLHPSTIKV